LFVALMPFSKSALLSQETSHFDVFAQTSRDVRQLWNAILDISLENTIYQRGLGVLKNEEAIQKIANISTKLNLDYCESSQRAVPQFLQTLATSLLKKGASDAEDCFIYVDDISIMRMEYLQMARSLAVVSDHERDWYSYDRIMSSILSISGKQGSSDYGGAKIQWEQSYWCPDLYALTNVVSDTFHDLGYYDKAWRSYLELAYFNKNPHLLNSKKYDDTPLSSKNAHNWYSAAENAYRAGEHNLAWGLLLKAAVFGDEKLHEQALNTAKQWVDVETGNAELPKQKLLASDERKKKLKEIVMVYKEMNAHPRAWAIIDEYKDEFDDPEGLKKEIQDDWIDLVDMLCGSAIRVVLYGYELLRTDVAEDGTTIKVRPYAPLDVTIPWIYPDGWREDAQKMLNEEMARLGVSHDRFRTWHAQGGKFSTEAKFVSCIDDKVTLEKPDGSVITIALDKLMAGDQNFVRYCLEVEKVKDSQPSALP